MLIEFEGYMPQVSERAFIAPTAVLVGNVIVRDDASVWFGAVLRADHGEHAIVVGEGTSVQDNCVIHVPLDRGTLIGKGVTLGHGVILEGCDIEDGAVIGMNSVVLQDACVGARSMLAAGSTVLPKVRIPPDSMAAGAPATVKKPISGGAAWWIERSSHYYVELANRYRRQGIDRLSSNVD